jgi:hypothetical protein
MATFLEPPPLASVAAVIGLAALSFAIGLSGGSSGDDAGQPVTANTPCLDAPDHETVSRQSGLEPGPQAARDESNLGEAPRVTEGNPVTADRSSADTVGPREAFTGSGWASGAPNLGSTGLVRLPAEAPTTEARGAGTANGSRDRSL